MARRLGIGAWVTGLAALWLLAACGTGAPEPVRLAGPTMGTQYNITLPRPAADLDPEALQAGIDALLARINRIMSTYDPESELSRFNRNPSTDWVPVSPELLSVVAEALRVSRLSGGAFDITVGPLVNLWGFGPDMGGDALPTEAAIAAARERVGYRKLQSSGSALKKDRPDVYLDLSAIAKGYGVDRVAAYLETRGVTDYLVEIGGELRAKGRNPRGEPWTIAVEKPSPGERAVERVIQVSGGGGVATSGDYRNFFEKDGQRYSHAIDPHSGLPIRHRLASVTVIRPDCMEADALATTLLVLGPEAGYALAERERYAALFIVIDGDRFVDKATPEFDQYLLN